MAMMPKTAGVYAFVGGKKVLYVGCSVNLYNRTATHNMKRKCKEAGAVEIRWVECHEKIEREAIELLAIRAYQPLFNLTPYGFTKAQILAESNFGETLQEIADQLLKGCRKPKNPFPDKVVSAFKFGRFSLKPAPIFRKKLEAK